MLRKAKCCAKYCIKAHHCLVNAASFLASGHSKAVRDISFNNPGTQFLSAGYDRYVKLWDTETGMAVS